MIVERDQNRDFKNHMMRENLSSHNTNASEPTKPSMFSGGFGLRELRSTPEGEAEFRRRIDEGIKTYYDSRRKDLPLDQRPGFGVPLDPQPPRQ